MKMPGSFAFPGVFEFRAVSFWLNLTVSAEADTRARTGGEAACSRRGARLCRSEVSALKAR